jgi:CheY-like chemotaxis protein
MKKVLLIDDDRDDAGLFSEALEEVNPALQVQHFENGRDALVSLQSGNNHLPDIIFLDINLPRFSGWDFLKQIKAEDHLSQIPVIMYTTSSQAREKEMAADLGAAGFLTKPNDYIELKEHLMAVLDVHS